MNERNPHTELYPWGVVVYWQKGLACGPEDEWDKAEVFVFPHNGVTLLHTSRKSYLQYIINSLDRAFAAGQRARSKEIRDLLG